MISKALQSSHCSTITTLGVCYGLAPKPRDTLPKDRRVLRPISKLQLREKTAQPAMEESEKLQSETVTKLRTLAHDLSNSIETIMQASYLLAQAKLDENNGKWLDLIDKAAQDAARINRQIREILRSQG